jgi:hypothetical protein
VCEAAKISSGATQVADLPAVRLDLSLEPSGCPLEAIRVRHQPGGALRDAAGLGPGQDMRAGGQER